MAMFMKLLISLIVLASFFSAGNAQRVKRITYNEKSQIADSLRIHEGILSQHAMRIKYKINGKKVDKSSYTIKYPNGRKNVGSYTIKVTMKKSSGYKGTAKTRFSIIPKGTSLKKPASTKKKTVKVTWKKQTKQVTGYEIQCSNFSDFRKVSKKVNVKSAKKTTVKINKLTSGKKYYVRIRTYKTIKGKKYYSKWSNKKSVRIK
jgi:hypothetical protein